LKVHFSPFCSGILMKDRGARLRNKVGSLSHIPGAFHSASVRPVHRLVSAPRKGPRVPVTLRSPQPRQTTRGVRRSPPLPQLCQTVFFYYISTPPLPQPPFCPCSLSISSKTPFRHPSNPFPNLILRTHSLESCPSWRTKVQEDTEIRTQE
jgi:hypothetical protein